MNTRTWCGLVLESRREYGSAARMNRARYSGTAVHAIDADYVVGFEPGYVPEPRTMGAEFARTGKPVLFSARPVCGCTQGQHAAQPGWGLTAADVTCSRCLKAQAPKPSLHLDPGTGGTVWGPK